jgi:hypothetical protein
VRLPIRDSAASGVKNCQDHSSSNSAGRETDDAIPTSVIDNLISLTVHEARDGHQLQTYVDHSAM